MRWKFISLSIIIHESKALREILPPSNSSFHLGIQGFHFSSHHFQPTGRRKRPGNTHDSLLGHTPKVVWKKIPLARTLVMWTSYKRWSVFGGVPNQNSSILLLKTGRMDIGEKQAASYFLFTGHTSINNYIFILFLICSMSVFSFDHKLDERETFYLFGSPQCSPCLTQFLKYTRWVINV